MCCMYDCGMDLHQTSEQIVVAGKAIQAVSAVVSVLMCPGP